MLHIAVFAKTSSKTKQMTQDCLDAIAGMDLPLEGPFSSVDVVLVESGEEFQYRGCKTIKYSGDGFNYNHACNIALEEMKKSMAAGDWTCFMNNDVMLGKLAAKAVQEAAQSIPALESACPDIGIAPDFGKDAAAVLGYVLKKTFHGCCYFLKDSALEKLGKFDETFDFYFQDDDLLEQLKTHGIKHAIVLRAKAKHIGQATTGTEDMDKLAEGAAKFIKKHSMETYIKQEALKRAKLKKVERPEDGKKLL